MTHRLKICEQLFGLDHVTQPRRVVQRTLNLILHMQRIVDLFNNSSHLIEARIKVSDLLLMDVTLTFNQLHRFTAITSRFRQRLASHLSPRRRRVNTRRRRNTQTVSLSGQLQESVLRFGAQSLQVFALIRILCDHNIFGFTQTHTLSLSRI